MLREGRRLIFAFVVLALSYAVYQIFFAYPFEDFRVDVIEHLTSSLSTVSTEDRAQLEGYLEALKATMDEDDFYVILDQMPERYFDEQ